MKRTFLVVLADRETGQEQRVLVRAESVNVIGPYMETRPEPVRGDGIRLAHPRVIDAREVRVPAKANAVFGEFVEPACA